MFSKSARQEPMPSRKHMPDMTIAFDQKETKRVTASIDRPPKPGLFRSYWIAGFEGADHINGAGIPLSLNQLNGHWDRLEEDYRALVPFGIKTVRESLGWRLTEHSGEFDWHRLERHARTAAENGIQIVWSLLHYGWPADVDPLSPGFAGRFARYCEQVARRLRPFNDIPPIFQPINEISFLTWAVCSAGLVAPNDVVMAGRGYELKKQLVKAALRGTEALRSIEPDARIVHTDPVIHVIPPAEPDSETLAEAARFREYQFQAWDMLCGRQEPQLGGSPRHLDILGLNYYHANQWVYQTEEILFWHLNDPRRAPFSTLAAEVWQRYGRPMFIAETSHVGEGRCAWLDDIVSEVIDCERCGVPIEGICLYPIIDRPDWENLQHWHHSGLWDIDPSKPDFERNLHQPYAERLLHWQRMLQDQWRSIRPSAIHPPFLVYNKST